MVMQSMPFIVGVCVLVSSFGCAPSRAPLTAAQKEAIMNEAAMEYAMGEEDQSLEQRSRSSQGGETVVSKREESPRIAAEPLPEGAFQIGSSVDGKTFRVEILMVEGPHVGKRFVCDLLASSGLDGKSSADCQKKTGVVEAACIDRNRCSAPFFERSRESDSQGGPAAPSGTSRH